MQLQEVCMSVVLGRGRSGHCRPLWGTPKLCISSESLSDECLAIRSRSTRLGQSKCGGTSRPEDIMWCPSSYRTTARLGSSGLGLKIHACSCQSLIAHKARHGPLPGTQPGRQGCPGRKGHRSRQRALEGLECHWRCGSRTLACLAGGVP